MQKIARSFQNTFGYTTQLPCAAQRRATRCGPTLTHMKHTPFLWGSPVPSRWRARLSGLTLLAAAWHLPLGAAPPSAFIPPVEVAGVSYAASQRVDGQSLVLNGAGIRHKAFVKVYVAGLYLPVQRHSTEAVLAEPGLRRMQITMLRDMDANELGKLFTQGMERNASREVFAKSINGTVRLAELFARKKRLASGDTFTVDWLPGKGTVVSINGHAQTDPVPEPEFFQALLGIWLGRAPADEQLKAALLGSS